MKERVVTISCSASIDGIKLDAEGATINLGINSIPSVELEVAPAYAQSASALKPAVYTPTVADFADLYAKLADKAQGLKSTGNVDITVKTDGYRAGTDTLSLKGWVLTGVGMSNVSATAAPHLVVIMQHPICKLTKIGSIYETPKTTFSKMIFDAASGKESYLDIMESVYATVRTASDAFYPTPTAMPAVFREHLGLGDFDPKQYLEESAKTLFLQGVIQDGKEMIAASIGHTVFPSSGGASTWDTILSSAGSLLLNVVQDENNNFTKKKLLLEPMRPWKSQTITLDEELCNWTDLPGMDTFKLVGVMARAFSPFVEAVSEGCVKFGNPTENDRESMINDVLYVPEGMSPETADGRIMKTSAPAVLDQAIRMDSASGDNIAGSEVQFVSERATGFNMALRKYCQAVYEITAGSMSMGKAQMALGFKDAGGRLILPGNTCKFVSKGKDIYYGYIKKVAHVLSTRGGCCTMVDMSHVRPREKYMVYGIPAVVDGNSNPAYE